MYKISFTKQFRLKPQLKLLIALIFFFILSLESLALAKDDLIFGITGVALKEDIITMRQWKEYLSEKIGKEVELRVARNYSEIKSMIETGSVDFAYVCGATFVELKENSSAYILAVPLVNKRADYYSFVIARNDTKIETIEDLKDKVFAFGDPKSNSGAIAPSYFMIKKGYHPKSFFKRLIYTYDHGESITAVLERFADAASVDSIVYNTFIAKNKEKSKHLHIIKKYGPFPTTPIVYRRGLDNNDIISTRNAILNMDKDKEGRAILKSLTIDKFVDDKSISYDTIAKMISFLKNHRL